MNRANLTESQLASSKLITRKLGRVGWDLDGWLSSFESITAVWPEVEAFFESETASLAVTYCFESEHVAVLIGTKDHEQYVEFRVYPATKLEELLELIIEYQETVSFNNYRGFVRSMRDLCGPVFWEEQGFEGALVGDEELDVT